MQGLSDETYRLLQYLDLASRANSGQDLDVEDFMREILRALRYEMRGLLLRSHCSIPLVVQSYSTGLLQKAAQTELCLVQGSSTILLVVQATVGVRDPEPQVIADAIATFQCNNRIRARLGVSELASMTIPCIAMNGTRPIFYLVPVTQELSQAVATDRYPFSPTVVDKCVVVIDSSRLSEGMEDPDFRRVALMHYSAFRTLAMVHWLAFMIPVETPNMRQIMGA
jgi:hypothetical protein